MFFEKGFLVLFHRSCPPISSGHFRLQKNCKTDTGCLLLLSLFLSLAILYNRNVPPIFRKSFYNKRTGTAGDESLGIEPSFQLEKFCVNKAFTNFKDFLSFFRAI